MVIVLSKFLASKSSFLAIYEGNWDSIKYLVSLSNNFAKFRLINELELDQYVCNSLLERYKNHMSNIEIF